MAMGNTRRKLARSLDVYSFRDMRADRQTTDTLTAILDSASVDGVNRLIHRVPAHWRATIINSNFHNNGDNGGDRIAYRRQRGANAAGNLASRYDRPPLICNMDSPSFSVLPRSMPRANSPVPWIGVRPCRATDLYNRLARQRTAVCN